MKYLFFLFLFLIPNVSFGAFHHYSCTGDSFTIGSPPTCSGDNFYWANNGIANESGNGAFTMTNPNTYYFTATLSATGVVGVNSISFYITGDVNNVVHEIYTAGVNQFTLVPHSANSIQHLYFAHDGGTNYVVTMSAVCVSDTSYAECDTGGGGGEGGGTATSSGYTYMDFAGANVFSWYVLEVGMVMLGLVLVGLLLYVVIKGITGIYRSML